MSELLQTKSVEELKQEMGPLKVSQILRQTKVKQTTGKWSDGTFGPATMFCARGAIFNHFGWDGDRCKDMTIYYREEDKLIPNEIQLFIQNANDCEGMTFEEIADELEKRGY